MALQLLNSNRSCTAKCRSLQHISDSSHVLSKASETQSQSYMLMHCLNFWRQHDAAGRSLVHWAASRGKPDVLDWLLGCLDANFTSKDYESGYTPLHRAILYGQITCAQVLLDYDFGLLTSTTDNEGLSVIDLLHKEQEADPFSLKGPTEVYSSGENLSFNLGHAHPTQRAAPEPVDYFRRQNISLIQVSMSKFHTLFLARGGEVFVCGHGLGGRLGLGTEEPQISPKQIPGLKCRMVSAGENHSLFLTADGEIYACGSNEYRQLGLGPGNQEPHYRTPQKVSLPKGYEGRDLIGCAAAAYHSVFWTSDTIFVCGLNGGQFGLSKEDSPIISSLKPVPFGAGHQVSQQREAMSESVVNDGTESSRKTAIVGSLSTSDGAMVVVSGRGDVWLFRDHSRSKISSKHLNVKSVAAYGGKLDPVTSQATSPVTKTASSNSQQDKVPKTFDQKSSDPIRVVLLTEAGMLHMWHEEDPVMRRCMTRGNGSKIYPSSMHPFRKGILFTTPDGRGFKAVFGKLPKKEEAKDTGKQLSATPPKPKAKSGKISSRASMDESLRRKGMLNGCNFLEPSECHQLTIERIPGVHRGISATCDPAGKNFAFLQQHPSRDLTEIPLVRSSEASAEMSSFFEMTQAGEANHDLEFLCGTQILRAHRYVVYVRSPPLRRMIEEKQCDDKVTDKSRLIQCNVSEMIGKDAPDARIFRELLRYLYTDTCCLLTLGNGWDTVRGPLEPEQISSEYYLYLGSQNTGAKSKKKKKGKGTGKTQQGTTLTDSNPTGPAAKSPIKQLEELARKIGLKDLLTKLTAVWWQKIGDDDCTEGVIRLTPHKSAPRPKLRFDSRDLTELYDVRIRTSDGKELQAHKCILSARLEYFRCMLNSGWREASYNISSPGEESPPLTIPMSAELVSLLLYFLYTDELPPSAKKMSNSEVPELVCRLLVAADQLLAERLREICESTLANAVSLRNVAELLEFAQTYNAGQLRDTCLQFICLNLPAILDGNALQNLSREGLDHIGTYYRNMYSQVGSRTLTPSPDGPTIEEIQVAQIQVESSEIDILELTSALLEENKAELAASLTNQNHSSQQSVPIRRQPEAVSHWDQVGSPMMSPPPTPSMERFEKQGWTSVAQKKKTKLKEEQLNSSPAAAAPVPYIPGLTLPDPMKETPKKTTQSVTVKAGHVPSQVPVTSPDIAKPMGKPEKSVPDEPERVETYFEKKRRLKQEEEERMKNSEENTTNEVSLNQYKPKRSPEPEPEKVATPKILPWWSIDAKIRSPQQEIVGTPGYGRQSPVSLRDVMASEEKESRKAAARASERKLSESHSIRLMSPETRPDAQAPEAKPKRTWNTVIVQPIADQGFPSLGASTPGRKKASSISPTQEEPRPPRNLFASAQDSSAPKNPWAKVGGGDFSDIIREEENKQLERSKHARKPLWVIQMEEQAMSELMRAYQGGENWDQLITVERVSAQFDEPIWQAHANARVSTT